MSGIRKFTLLFLMTFPLLAVEEGISPIYQNGIDAYKNGQYDFAIQE